MGVVLTASFFVAGWRDCVARIALGLHWPGDVFLTSLICMLWIRIASRSVLRNA
jgi:hypothetical protein